MNRLLVSIPSLLVAAFSVACGDDAGSTQGTGGAGVASGGVSSGNVATGGVGAASPGAGGAGSGQVGTGGTNSGGTTISSGGNLVGSGGLAVTPDSGGAPASTGGSSEGSGGSSDGSGGSSEASGGTSGGAGGFSAETGGSSNDAGGTSNASGGNGPSTGGMVGGVGGGSQGFAGAAGGDDQGTGGTIQPVVEPEVITSSNGNWWTEVTPTKSSGGNASITVDPGRTHQTWIGFGGTFNEKGWAALSELSPEERSRAIRLLFSKTEGAGFTMGRMPMGSSDYALTRYTYNDTAGDTSMSNFSIAKDETHLIPYIKAALEVNRELFIWGSPWTPPPWMKDNNDYDKGNMKGDQATLQAYALYFSKYISAYKEKGITISAVAPQNEPGYPQDYPSCLWSSDTFKSFVNILGPMLQTDAPDVEIWLATMSNTQTDGGIVDAVLNDSTARGFVSSIGVQWGMMDQAANYVSRGLPIHQTEHRCGNYPFGYTPPAGSAGGDQSKAPNDFNYGLESWYYIRKFINDGGHSYSAWNMVLDSIGRSLDTVRPWAQNAPLIVENGRLIETPAYYVFRHAAQFVDPGAVRIDTSANDGFAFKNPDGDIVLVMQANSTQTITVGIEGTTLSFPGPGQGWVTVNYRPEG